MHEDTTIDIFFIFNRGRFVVDLSIELGKDNEVILVQILSNDNKLNVHYLPVVSERIKYVNAVVLPHMCVGVFSEYATVVGGADFERIRG